MLSGSQIVAFVLFNIAAILIAARFFGAAAKRVGQPAVVGEIIAGVVLGPSLLGLITLGDAAPAWLHCPETGATLSNCIFQTQARPVLNALGQIALLLFMFLVGLELDFGQLKGKVSSVLAVAVGVVVIPIGIAFAINPVLFTETFVFDVDTVSRTGFALFVAAFISITALPVMVRILQEKGKATSDLGVVGIAAAAIVTVLMFVLVSVASGLATGTSGGRLLRNVVLIIIYLLVMVLAVRPLLARMLGEPYEARAVEIGIKQAKQTWSGLDEFAPAGAGEALSHAMFAWTLVLVFLSGWVAHVLGINVIVGGFMAGVAMPQRAGLIRDMTTELFDVVVTILLPIFLAFAGLNADFTQLSLAAVPGLAVFLLACVIAKWGGAFVIGRATGLSGSDANLLGVLMNCRGLLPLVVGLVGLNAEVISPTMNVAAVTMALITTGMTGPLFDRFNRSAPEPAVA